ncbi:MAG: hypothetical protein PWP24_360 [Clostridiales bacterium]|nr:hypothetical protein [Clostridiales bacterium]
MFTLKKKRFARLTLILALSFLMQTTMPVSAKTTLLSTPFYPTDFTHNPVFDNCILLHGIDVSKYQKVIDWEKARAAGVEFAFIRAGYRGYGAGGNFGADEYYEQNIQGAINAGIPVGVYFFSQATTEEEAIEEANYLLERVSGYEISLPLVMDFEYASANGKQTGRLYDANLSMQEATDVCLAFCARIKEAGYSPMVYANYTMLTKGLYAELISAQYDIWLANYTNETSYSGSYSFWQYTSSGSVDGIDGKIDANFWYKKTPDQVLDLTPLANTAYAIVLNWEESEGGQGYQIYRSAGKKGAYEKVTTVSGSAITAFTDASVTSSTPYYYKVRAYLKFGGKNYFGPFSEVISTYTIPNTIDSLTAKPLSDTSVSLSWNKATDSDGYRLYVYDEDTGTKTKIKTISSPSQTSYVLNGLDSSKIYSYQIASFKRIDSKARFGAVSEPLLTSPLPSRLTTLTIGGKTSSRIRLNWSEVAGADGYQIYCYDKAAKKYVKLKTVKSDTLTYVASSLHAKTDYTFKVRAYKRVNGKNYFGKATKITAKTTK